MERRGRYWKFFEKKEKYLATCKICFNDYSYRATTTNLKLHLKNKHGVDVNSQIGDSIISEVGIVKSPTIKPGTTMNYFDLLDSDTLEAKCKLCDKNLSFEAVEDLKKHITEDHGENTTDMDSNKKTKSKCRARYWNYFTKKELYVATCNICCNDYSFRSTTSNLMKHLRNRHGVDVTIPTGDSDSEVEIEKSSSKKSREPTWKYFEVLDSDKFEAQCKLCEKSITYESVEDLKKHVEDHGENPLDSDDEDSDPKPRHVSIVWKYFKKLDTDRKFALCLICQKVYNAETTNNLKKHLKSKHPVISEEDEKKYIVAANGQLYEMESETEKSEINDNNEDKDPIEMDTVYLEDLDDSLEMTRHSTPSPQKKKAKLITSKTQSFSKPRKEQIFNNSSNNENNVTPLRRNSYNTSLDYFGQYVVSLLKELPKSVSSQLQNEIIKQILMSKVALESEGTKCKVSINQNADNETNITEPVMYIQAKPST